MLKLNPKESRNGGSARQDVKTDPFLLEIIRNYLVTTCQEMGTTMMRTSFSPVFNEARDFIVVVFDKNVELLAQVDFVPAMLGSARHGVKLALHEVGIENLEPGDIIITNDPYRSNNHIPEHIVVKPNFLDGKIVSYTGCIGHMVDVGGTVPGAFGLHENCFQEGLRIPPVKLYKADREVDDIWKLVLSNTRTPKSSYGDFKAMVSALYKGEQRIFELIDRYGLAAFEQACHDIKAVSEMLMRRQIAAWPKGTYEVEDVFESDGVTPNRAWRLKAKLVVRDDDLIIDFSGSDEPAAGSMAMTFGSSSSAGYEAVFQMASNDIPINEGCYRCITVISPYGKLTNTPFPHASMAGNSEGQPVVIDMLIRAFAQFSNMAPAPDANSCGLIAFGGMDHRSEQPFAYLSLEGVGWGGSRFADGNSVQFSKLANCAVQPIEVVESRFPMIHEEYEIQPFRGGAGKYRSGFGSRRHMRLYGKEMVASSTISRSMLPAPGLSGGHDGATNTILFRSRKGGDWQTAKERYDVVAPGMFSNVPMTEEDEVLVITGQGGGYGNPFDRDPASVLEDVQDELLTVDQARAHFGVVVTGSPAKVDAKATETARKEQRQ
ncbi:MAG: hydantoinase B/oxoprolinase family protein [Parvibaculaceae bacterium]